MNALVAQPEFAGQKLPYLSYLRPETHLHRSVEVANDWQTGVSGIEGFTQANLTMAERWAKKHGNGVKVSTHTNHTCWTYSKGTIEFDGIWDLVAWGVCG